MGQLFKEASEITGQDFRIADFMAQHISEAGFINVAEKVLKTPLGGWPADQKLRELGQWALLAFDTGLEGYALATLTRVLEVCGLNTACSKSRTDDNEKTNSGRLPRSTSSCSSQLSFCNL